MLLLQKKSRKHLENKHEDGKEQITSHVSNYLFQKYGSSVHDPNSEYMFMAAVNTNKKSRLAGVTS